MAGMNNPPGTPRDDGEMAGNFLNPFQSESVSTKRTNIQLNLGIRMRITNTLSIPGGKLGFTTAAANENRKYRI